MPTPPEKNPREESLSDEDLRALARRHGSILRRSRARLEREMARREQHEMIYSVARQMAAAMLAAEAQNKASEKSGKASVPVAEDTVPATKKSEKKLAKKTRFGAGIFSKKEKKTAAVPAENSATSEPVPVVAEHHFEPSAETTPLHRFLRKIGAGGLSFSIIFHSALIFIAVFWVVARYVEPPEPEVETFFATGSGGGNGGENPSLSDRQSKRRASKIGAEMRENKIIAKKSSLVLPEVKKMPAMNFSGALSSALASGKFGDGASSGSGGGAGGGVGLGIGTGIGNGRNFVGKFQTTQKILGTNVTAEKLAVYMDSSPSMTEVAEVVRREILTKFPTADVFQFWGCDINPSAGVTTISRSAAKQKRWDAEKKSLLKKFEREKKLKKMTLRKALKSAPKKKNDRLGTGDFYEQDKAWRGLLSSYGKALLREWERGEGRLNLGTWLDMTLTEGGYDALFVFADFQDYQGNAGKDAEAWTLEHWLALARKNGQRLYFFTTEFSPAQIFCELALQTGGDIAIPRETAKKTEMARFAEREIAMKKRRAKMENSAPKSAEKLASEQSTMLSVPAVPAVHVPAEADVESTLISSPENVPEEMEFGGSDALDFDGDELW